MTGRCLEKWGLSPSTAYLGERRPTGERWRILVIWPFDAAPLVSPDFPVTLASALIPSKGLHLFHFSLWTHSGVSSSPKPQVHCQDPLTTNVLGHGHEVVVGNTPQVLGSLGQ